MEQFILDFISKYPMITMVLGILGTLMVAAQAIVLITPTKKDDEFVDGLMKKAFIKKIFDLLISFAPFKKK